MANTLLVNASVNGENSYSKKLANEIVRKLLEKDPKGETCSVDLCAMPFPQLSAEFVDAYWKPVEDRTAEEHAGMALSDQATQDLLWADNLVIGLPLTNFAIPSLLKSWFEHIIRPGLTFQYSSAGQLVGKLSGKTVYVAISSGGVFSHGPAKSMDHATPYLHHILGFLGIADVRVFYVEGVRRTDLKDNALSKAFASITVDGPEKLGLSAASGRVDE